MSLCPPNELLRVTALHDCGVLDTSPEESFDELTRLLAHVCQAPIALISFIDSERQWNKSAIGLDVREIPRHQSICAHTILNADGLMVENCAEDARFQSSPLVRGLPGIRFYAGAPIRTAEGLAVGSVAVMDTRPRSLSKETSDAIRTIARQAAVHLALRRSLLHLQEKQTQTEFALRESKTIYHSLVESLPQNVFRKDAEGRFTFANSKFCSTIKRHITEIIGKKDTDLFPADLAAKYRADDLEVIRGRRVVDTIEKHQSPEGLIYVHVIKTPLFNSKGEATGIQGMFWDETERHKAQLALGEARDAALESARLKSEFLANMSHEIRTPMNAILGMTGLLLDTDLGADQRDFADTIRLSAEALLNIINDILDFSKIEAGKLAMESIDFDLREIVEGAGDLLAERAQTKGVELATWIHDEAPRMVCGDPGRLRQVLTNLLSNAVKFTDKGEVALDVSCIESKPDRATLRFEVRDTGIGVPAEAHNRIFQAFTQADGSMTRRFGGTGLGLAITKQLVELMQGRIGFTSEAGKGSTFWFELPMASKAASQPSKVDPKLQGCRVLIVDDSATTRKILEHQTKSWQMRNACARSADEALELMRKAAAERDPFKIVLLDMQMPGTDGIMLANKIKKEPAIAATRLIMLTSLGYLPSEKLWKEVGVSAYVVKPVKQSRLLDVLSEVIHEPEPEVVAPKTTTAPANAKSNAKETFRLLLAEDNAVNQKVALRQLSKLGFQVDAVNNGAEAVKAIERHVYPIILMDCQMPELDGYKATACIREMYDASPFRWAHRPYIIAMTANALAGDRETCLASGMDDYVSKPVRMEELEAALQRGIEAMQNGDAKAGAGSSGDAVIDAGAMENLRSLRIPGEPDPLVELVQLFLADTPERLKNMAVAAKKKDGIALEAAAHSLKGSASNLGASQLAATCARLIHMGRANDFTSAAEAVRTVEEDFAKVKAELLKEIGR